MGSGGKPDAQARDTSAGGKESATLKAISILIEILALIIISPIPATAVITVFRVKSVEVYTLLIIHTIMYMVFLTLLHHYSVDED